MPTEIDPTSGTFIPSHYRDTPRNSNPVSELPELEVREFLEDVEGPLNNIPENARIIGFNSDQIPGTVALRHCVDLNHQIRIMNAVLHGHKYLQRPTLKRNVEITRSNLKRPLFVDALRAIEKTLKEFRVLTVDGKIFGAAPRPENLKHITKLLGRMRETYQYEFVGQGLAIPIPPVWGRNNDAHQWWRINDYEILSAAFRHEAEFYLKLLSPYLPKGELELEPTTFRPPSLLPQPFSERPRKTFKICNTKLSATISAVSVVPNNPSEGQYPPRQSWNISYDESDNPFLRNEPSNNSERVGIIPKPGESLSNRSDSDDSDDGSEENNKPPKPFQPSLEPSSLPFKGSSKTPVVSKGSPESYHFNMKLKPETIPTWDGNEDTLARWMEKVEQMANISPNIFRELGKIVPRRLTDSAEAWYYSIPPKNRKPMESNWGTLKTAIADYWMNHTWLEDQKSRANTARYRDAGHTHETPSEYIIRKMDLIRLVYDYTDSEIIRLIMKEAPGAWSSLLQAQFCETVVQFQNAVKYHESTLLAMTPQAELGTTPAYLENYPENNLTSDDLLVSDDSTYPHDPGPSGVI